MVGVGSRPKVPLLDARARKIADFAKVNRDHPDFYELIRALAVQDLRAAVREETTRCTALVREAMSGMADAPRERQRKRRRE